jgi:DNA-binding transcriptional regulator GbsR (MarR family)
MALIPKEQADDINWNSLKELKELVRNPNNFIEQYTQQFEAEPDTSSYRRAFMERDRLLEAYREIDKLRSAWREAVSELNQLQDIQAYERKIRRTNPGVQEAYDKYLVMLKLADRNVNG